MNSRWTPARLLAQTVRVGGLILVAAIFGMAMSCNGFFVSPVLTGIAVGPSATIQTGNTVQMSAVGTYDDGSQKELDSGLFWSSDTPAVAVVSSSGLVKGLAPGKALITGAHKTVSAAA